MFNFLSLPRQTTAAGLLFPANKHVIATAIRPKESNRAHPVPFTSMFNGGHR
jgi:hypothetical protein